MARGHATAATPAWALIALLLVLPTLQGAVTKPKPKPKPKPTLKTKPKPKPAPTLKKLTWKALTRAMQWQWQLDDSGSITKVPGVSMYDIDLDTAADQIKVMRKAIKGVQIICYISVGTWEAQRQELDRVRRGIPYAAWKGLTGQAYSPPFQDEKWLDIRNPRVKNIMLRRFDYARRIGCDGIEPDNTGAYQESTGFPLTAQDSLAYSQWIAAAVHARGMSVGLKNTVSLLPQLNKLYDWFLNEQCPEDSSCGAYLNVGKVKPVYIVEYCDATEQGNGVTQDPGCFCPGLIKAGFNVLLKTTDVNSPRTSCAEYCSRYSCPGRGGRPNCNASRANVCASVFRVPPRKLSG